MKKIAIILLVLVLAVLGGYWWYRGSARAEESSLVLHGNVDIREVNLGFRVPGRLENVSHEEGDAVKKGEVLATLDQTPYRLELDEAKAQASAARSQLTLLETGYRTEEIAQARATVREREVFLENARKLFERQQALAENHAISEQEREDSEARYREAEARLNSSRSQLALLKAGYRKEQVEQARADLARAEAAMRTAEVRLADASIVSPSDGVVLTRAQEPGAIVAAGTPVLTVSLREPVWVRAYVHEPDLGRVHPGQKVQVTTDSRPNQPYEGQIGYISPRAEFTPRNVETEELRTSLVYRLRITVENPDEGLRQGMPVTVRVTAQARN